MDSVAGFGEDALRDAQGEAMAEWVCDFCGRTGATEAGETTDHVLCPDCGEPVTPG